MNQKTLDLKLAKDIARFRLLSEFNNSLNEPAVKTTEIKTFAEETIRAMKELDANQEVAIAKEIQDTIAKVEGPDLASKDKASRKFVGELISESYIKGILCKLKIRALALMNEQEKKRPQKFKPDDYAFATKLRAEEIDKAVKLISDAIKNGQKDTMINMSCAEAYGYNFSRTEQEIQNIISSSPDTESFIIKFDKTIFLSANASNAIELLEKTLYYNKWIYEHYQTVGIIVVTIEKN